MARVIQFELQSDDPAALIRFFEDVFDWDTDSAGPGAWDAITGSADRPGIDGVIRRGAPSTCLTIEVESLDTALAAVRDRGGTTDGDRIEIPGVGTQAYCRDPAGNLLALLQPR